MRYWLIVIGFVLGGRTWADEPNQFQIGKTQQFVFLPDGKAVLGRCDNRCLILYDLNGRVLAGDNSISGYLQHIAVDPTGRWAASAELAMKLLPATDGKKVEEVAPKPQPQIRIWSLPDLKLQHTIALDGGGDVISDIVFAPDGKTLASLRPSAEVRLWDVATGRRKHAWSGDKQDIQSIHFNPAGDKLQCAGVVGQIVEGSFNFMASDNLVIRDAATGKRVQTLDVRASHVALSADRRWMYTQAYWYEKSPKGALTVNGVTFADRGDSAVLDRLAGRTTFRSDSWLGRVSVAGPFLAYWLQDPEYSMSSEVVERFVGPRLPWEHLRVMELRTGQDCWRRRAPAEVTAFALSGDGRRLAVAYEKSKVEIIDLFEQASPKHQAAPKDLAAAWRDLAAPDAARLLSAWRTLRADHSATLRLLRKELLPAKLDDKLLALRLEELNDPVFTVRAKSAGELLKMDSEGWLSKALSKPLSTEQREGIEQLLAKFANRPLTPEQLQQARALDLLSQLPQTEAVAFLRELASGDPEAWLTREAKYTLQSNRR